MFRLFSNNLQIKVAHNTQMKHLKIYKNTPDNEKSTQKPLKETLKVQEPQTHTHITLPLAYCS